MISRRLLRILAILGLAAVVVGSALWWRLDQWPLDNQVIFLNVGQGDSTLLLTAQGQRILIDGGPDKSVLYELSKYLPWWDRRLDVVILTHPHSDHVAGLVYVLRSYQVDQVMSTGVSYVSASYQAWQEVIEQEHIPEVLITEPQVLDLGDCQLRFLYPDFSLQDQEPGADLFPATNLNNTSVVSRLTCGSQTWLLTGDIEEEVESYLLDRRQPVAAQVLKVPHHGSKTSCTAAFVQAVSPHTAVISLSKDNRYGFPVPEVLERLNSQVQSIFLTYNGSVLTVGGQARQ